MPYIDKEARNANERAKYARKREAKLLRVGLDPNAFPIKKDGTRGPNIVPRKDSVLPEWLFRECMPLPGESSDDHHRRRSRLTMNYRNGLLTEEERERKNANARANYHKDWDRIRAMRKASNEANPEAVKEWQKKYFEANKEKRLATLKAWGEKNHQRLREARENWAKTNRHILNQYSAAYRAQLANAAPPWTDWDAISKVYEECAQKVDITGTEHNVDHIIPINGKTVCGLHVWWNLRVITQSENCKKSNNWLQEDGVAPM